MEDYLSGRIVCLSPSIEDDEFAALENAAAELQHAHSLERERRERVLKEEADFLADVSHQFKTPLAAIRLFSEMDEAMHKDQQLQLVDRMEQLIYALLRLEKFKAGAYELEFNPRNLADSFREISAEMKLLYPDIGIDIQGNAVLRCDEKYLWEAVGNVVKNACQHAKEKVEIQLETNPNSVFIYIEDDGGGVPENDLGFLFRRFSPVSGKDPQSTGLGLAIAREIVEKHHGTIHAENGEKGLRITMCFAILQGRLAIS